MSHEHDQQGLKFTALYSGTVVDNVDPQGLARVRVEVPGVVERSAWAFPLGGLRSGGKGRGLMASPPLGAEVGVLFVAGDPDHPRYLTGHFGAGEVPALVAGYAESDDPPAPATPKELTEVVLYEGERYVCVLDERPGKERFLVRDKQTGDRVLLDGAKGAVEVRGTAIVNLESAGALNITALSVTINGRLVKPVGPAI